MSPQGRKRASAMVARDFRTVSGIGQSYHNNNQTLVVSVLFLDNIIAMIWDAEKTLFVCLFLCKNIPFTIKLIDQNLLIHCFKRHR